MAVIPFDVIGWGRWGWSQPDLMAGVSRGLVSLWEHRSVSSRDTFTMPWQVGLLLWPVVGLPACLPSLVLLLSGDRRHLRMTWHCIR